MDSFYITLPSNVFNPSFKNKANHYKTHFPTELDLKGKWQCALSEITFDKKWKTVEEDTIVKVARYVEVRTELNDKLTHELTIKDIDIKIESGYYQTPHEYISMFMTKFEATTLHFDFLAHYYKSLKLEFEEETGKITMDVEGDVRWDLRFEPKIGRMLGLPKQDNINFSPPRTIFSWSPPMEMLPTPCLYVYCDIIEENIV